MRHPVSEGGDIPAKAPEKKWGGPSETLVKKLENQQGEGGNQSGEEGAGKQGGSKPPVPEKKKWGGPSDTLLNVLAQKPVVAGTLSGGSNGKVIHFFSYSENIV